MNNKFTVFSLDNTWVRRVRIGVSPKEAKGVIEKLIKELTVETARQEKDAWRIGVTS